MTEMNTDIPNNNLQIPTVTYKYRKYQSLHIQSLLKKQIYIPSAQEFNDPFDSRIPFRYNDEDMTPENIYRKAISLLKRSKPGKSEEEYQQATYDILKEGRLFDPEYLKRFDKADYENLCNTFGVFCLTPDPENFLMWSYYSDSHKGFCIGYNTQNLLSTEIFRMVGPVQYTNEFPKRPMFPTDQDSLFVSMFYTKWEMWKHENEYRLLHLYKTGKIKTLPTDCISEVILGCQFPENEKNAFTAKIIDAFPNAKIFQMELLHNTFGLKKISVFDSTLFLNLKHN